MVQEFVTLSKNTLGDNFAFSNPLNTLKDFFILPNETFLFVLLALLLIAILYILFIAGDRILSFLENEWPYFYRRIFVKKKNISGPYGLDQSSIEVIEDTKIKFKDVAGNEEAKAELKEVVKFLTEPQSFLKLGAVAPKGVLLGGPPGTGKTLLAKAVAGESGVPFLKISGAQFVELLVGVGAARVRELFQKARNLKPSIIFIDEIDSIAKTRSGGSGSTNEEREQTLNQILVEMDGFKVDTGILVIAASNRIDILDPAILRAGRFDRQIILTKPTVTERLAILEVHARGKKVDPSVSLADIAEQASGFSGAELANVLNEAAILATRSKKSSIQNDDIKLSIDRIVYGLEGKPITRVKSRQIIGFHEMGHALVGSLVNETNPVDKVSLLVRGKSKGRTSTIPSQSQFNPRDAFLAQIFVSISGRASEEVIGGIGECTGSAQDDIAQTTRKVRAMVVKYAMAKLQEFKQEAQQRNLYLLGSDMKLELNNVVDNFTTNFMDLTYKEAITFLEILRPNSERLVDELMASGELTGMELRALASEYITPVPAVDILDLNRQSLLYELLIPELGKAVQELEKQSKSFLMN